MSSSSLTILVNDEEKHTAALASVDQVAGAKSVLDSLFVQWLSVPRTEGLLQTLVADAKAGRPLTMPSASSSASSSLAFAPKGILSPVRDAGVSSPPPRSPTRSPVRTPEPKSPRSLSPQHFTFGRGDEAPSSPSHSPVRPTAMKFGGDEGGAGAGAGSASGPPGAESGGSATAGAAKSAGSSPAPGAAGSSSSSSASSELKLPALGSAAKTVPRFYNAGEGGRGRGRPIPGETLKDKLPAILEVWRRNQMDAAAAAALTSSPSAGGSPKAIVGALSAAGAADVAKELGVDVPAKDLESGLPVEQFAAVAKTLCGFPSFFAAPLFRRVRLLFEPAQAKVKSERHAAQVCAAVEQRQPPVFEETIDTEGTVPLVHFLQYWKQEMEPFDHYDRYFRLVGQPGSRGIYLRDFMPLLEELLAFHPGLAFLEGTPEFQEKYARTVIARIFYVLDPLARGYIDIRSLRRSNLLHAFHTVDMEEDINLVNDYFSYEHFYVLYCKFWELDTDRDFLLTREDLNRMDNLTHSALDRVFSQSGRPFTSGRADRMGYEDFICFLLSEEDKTNLVSLAYWFRVVDLNGDGIITPDEMRHFYLEQMQRMADLNLEVVPFEDVLSQMTDLLQPSDSKGFRFKDFTHPSRVCLTGVFFSVLFNLAKFTAFESRDPVYVKQELNEQGITQWDRYAQIEYMRLAEEEEAGMDEAELSMELDGMNMGEFA